MAHQTHQTNGICEFNIIQLAIMILAHTFSVVQMVLKASQTPWFRYVTQQVTSLTIPFSPACIPLNSQILPELFLQIGMIGSLFKDWSHSFQAFQEPSMIGIESMKPHKC